jgi:hypothetical protein
VKKEKKMEKKLPSDIVIYQIFPFIQIMFNKNESITLKDVVGKLSDSKIKYLFSCVKLKWCDHVNLNLLNVRYLECIYCTKLNIKYPLKNVKVFKIKKCYNITNQTLGNILQNMPNLKHLEIDQCPIETFCCTLNKLSVFVVKNIKKLYWNLLKNMKNIETLTMMNCDICCIKEDFRLEKVKTLSLLIVTPLKVSMLNQFPYVENVTLNSVSLEINSIYLKKIKNVKENNVLFFSNDDSIKYIIKLIFEIKGDKDFKTILKQSLTLKFFL